MSNLLIIIAIIAAIFALLVEILCTKEESKLLWLGADCLFFGLNCLFFLLFFRGAGEMPLPKQILIFILVAMASAMIAMIAASIILAVIEQRKNKDNEGKAEPPAEEEGGVTADE